MNWNRAKSILLVIFVALNLVLAYYNFWRPSRVVEATLGNDAAYAAIRDRLLDEKITLLQSIPKKAPKTSYLTLKRDSTPLALADNLFANDQPSKEIIKDEEGRIHYIIATQNQELIIAPDGFMTYYNFEETPKEDDPLISYEFARTVAESFIKERLKFGTLNYSFSSARGVKAISGVQRVAFNRNYQGAPLFDIGLEVKITGDQVKTSSINIYNTIVPEGKLQWAAPAGDILLRLLEDELVLGWRDEALNSGENWLVITDITFGYFSFFATGTEVKAYPVWRVAFKDGQLLYYDAFTAERVFYS